MNVCLPFQATANIHILFAMCLQGNADGFGGEFLVPSYRGSTFLDPKGRGAATGYDNAVALPAAADAGAFSATFSLGKVAVEALSGCSQGSAQHDPSSSNSNMLPLAPSVQQRSISRRT